MRHASRRVRSIHSILADYPGSSCPHWRRVRLQTTVVPGVALLEPEIAFGLVSVPLPPVVIGLVGQSWVSVPFVPQLPE